MVHRALFVGTVQALVDQTQVKAGFFGFFNGIGWITHALRVVASCLRWQALPMRQLPPLILPALVFGATAGYVAEIAKRRHFSLFIDELQNVVRVPVPERYAIHKLIVSQIRGTATSKVAKDL